MFPLLTHVFYLWIIVQTPGLIPFYSMIQKLVFLSFILQQVFQADTHVSCHSLSFKLFHTCATGTSTT
jgi:hypothetical protein